MISEKFQLKSCSLLFLLLITLSVFGCDNSPKQSPQERINQLNQPNKISGIAYIQTAGSDHIAAVNLNDKRVSRIKLDKRLGAIALDTENQILYVGSSDGHLTTINLTSGEKQPWLKVTESISAAVFDGTMLYILDPVIAKLISYDISKNTQLNTISLEKGQDSLSISTKNNTLYIGNHLTGNITGFNTADFTNIFTLEKAGNSIHKLSQQSNSTLWIAEGNEFKDGKPYGIGYAKAQAQAGGINIVVPNQREIDDFIYVGGNVVDIQFSPDEKYALTAASRMPENFEASLAVVDAQSRRIIEQYSICNSCHVPKKIDLEDEDAVIHGLQVNWGIKSFSKASTAMQ